MKVYLEPDTDSRGIMRVRDALLRFIPEGIDVVQTSQEADFEVIHVWGRHTTTAKRIEKLRIQNKPYAMIQYVLRSSMRPSTIDWWDMWTDAKFVWSYYDLYHLSRVDYVQSPDNTLELPQFNFYYAPLGVDPEVFHNMNYWADPLKFIIGASSQHALSESVRECAYATKAVGGKMFHLGHELRRGPDIVCETNLTDEHVAMRWSECAFVSGLRRIEGFELPVIEGALCGARPIVFDRPEMRKWFGEFAVFIPEGTRDEVINDLEAVFRHGADPVREEEKELIKHRFDWEKIIKGFWSNVV